MKYGLLAQAVIVDVEGFGENQEDFDMLLSQLNADLAPKGRLEEMLVEKIGVSYWRQRRVLRAEVGKIGSDWDSESESLNDAPYPAPMTDLIEGSSPLVSSYKGTLRGLNTMLVLLKAAESEISKKGIVSEPTQKHLYHVFGRKDSFIARKIFASCYLIENAMEPSEDETKYGKGIDSKACEAKMLRELKSEIEHYEALVEVIEETELKDRKFKRMALSVSTGEESMRLWRYETMIERQCNKYMDQLERLQRRRLGEAVLPPINVNLTTDIEPRVQ